MPPIGLRFMPVFFQRLMLLIAFALALAMLPPAAFGHEPSGPSKIAEGINTETGNPITLRIYMQAPCTNPAAIAVLVRRGAGQIIDQFKAASITWEGTVYAGCWIFTNHGTRNQVFAMFEDDSNLGRIPFSRFRDEGI